MAVIQVGHHIQGAVDLVEEVERRVTDTAITPILNTVVVAAVDWVLHIAQ